MRVTVDMVMSWHPCRDYSRERVEQLWNGRKYINHKTLEKLPIPLSDILWALLNLLDSRAQHEIACDFAETTLHLVEDGEERPRRAIEIKRRWLCGEATDEELVSAGDAAWDAAWVSTVDAAWYAASAASRTAVWVASNSSAMDAAWYAARAAACYAVGYAAGYAAWDAARAAAYEKYIDMVLFKIDNRGIIS
jgi:hypothetical protein